jgi:hypothetical protein
MRTMTPTEIASINAQIASAVSIADVTRIARVACGYRITRAAVEYTEADRAWFKRPIGGAQ